MIRTSAGANIIGNSEDFENDQVVQPGTPARMTLDQISANSMGPVPSFMSDTTGASVKKKPMPTRNTLTQNRLLNSAAQQTKQLLESGSIHEEAGSDDENKMLINK